MGKIKNLISDTLLFAASTFSSKLLIILLLPLLTSILAPEEFSVATNTITAANFILPIMYLCISEAVIRFGLDPAAKKRDIFTAGFLTVLGGCAISQVILSLALTSEQVRAFVGYEALIRIFILTSAMRTVVIHFVRASGLKRVFALDGLLTTVTTLALTYIFLIPLKLGGQGYVLATVCADAFSAIGLIAMLRLHRFVRLRGMDFSLWKKMLAYSIPLVPPAVFWWITNLSGHFFVTAICGDAENGLYAAATKLPTAITLVSAIFTQAWQISAFSEQGGKERERFFSTVFRSYYTFVFLAASGIIMLLRPLTGIIMSEAYYESWQYAPFLVVAVSFSCFVTFLGTVYNTAKKNAMVSITTAAGGALNLFLNWLLIPVYGVQGAAFSTFVSYALVFIIRAVDSKKYIKIDMQPLRIAASLGLLLLQVWVCLSQPPLGMLWQAVIFISLAFCNLGYIIYVSKHLIGLCAGMLKGGAS